MTITSTMIDADVSVVFMPLHKSMYKNSKSGTGSQAQNSQGESIAPQKAKKTTLAEPIKAKKKSAKKTVSKKTEKKEKAKKEKQKKVENEKAEKKITQPVAQEKPVPAVQPVLPEAGTSVTENVVIVGQQEMDALELQNYLHQELVNSWRPPMGMRKNVSCVVKIQISFDGALSCAMEQSSGVLIFDDAAQRAARTLQVASWMHGKELLITFKP